MFSECHPEAAGIDLQGAYTTVIFVVHAVVFHCVVYRSRRDLTVTDGMKVEV